MRSGAAGAAVCPKGIKGGRRDTLSIFSQALVQRRCDHTTRRFHDISVCVRALTDRLFIDFYT